MEALIEFHPPLLQPVETLAVHDVVDEHAGVAAAVEGCSEGLEAFLSGGVPYGEGDGLDLVVWALGDFDLFGEVVRSDGCLVLSGEFVGVVSVHEGCFADARVAKNDKFESDLPPRIRIHGRSAV